MRILVTGSRELKDANLVRREIAKRGVKPFVIVSGGCPTGTDKFAEDIKGEHHVFMADWSAGRKAGPIRNQAMVDAGADLCLAFYRQGAENRGTADCVMRALKAGIPVVRFIDNS